MAGWGGGERGQKGERGNVKGRVIAISDTLYPPLSEHLYLKKYSNKWWYRGFRV